MALETLIGPEEAPSGTLVIIWVGVELIISARMPLKRTVFIAEFDANPKPLIYTIVPTVPKEGFIEVMNGGLGTVVNDQEKFCSNCLPPRSRISVVIVIV